MSLQRGGVRIELSVGDIIHCLGPVFGLDEPAHGLIASCYRCALEQAEEHRLESVAFPSISTGAFNYPMQDAARLALDTIAAAAPQGTHTELVRLVMTDSTAFATHETAMGELLRKPPRGSVVSTPTTLRTGLGARTERARYFHRSCSGPIRLRPSKLVGMAGGSDPAPPRAEAVDERVDPLRRSGW